MGSLLFFLHFFANKFHSNIFASSFVNALLYYGEPASGKQKGEKCFAKIPQSTRYHFIQGYETFYPKWLESNILLGIYFSVFLIIMLSFRKAIFPFLAF